MSNYGRDELWDTATWAELDQVVIEEAKRVRVAQKIFRTEDVQTPTGGAPLWVSTAKINHGTELSLSESAARPFVEISVPFRLSPGQVEAEETLHTARTLARAAAKYLAMAEDNVLLRGNAAKVKRTGVGIHTRNHEDPAHGLVKFATRHGKKYAPVGDEGPKKLVEVVVDGIAALASAGWDGPYALILDGKLYAVASRRLRHDSEETPADRLSLQVRHCAVSSSLDDETGILASLAGEGVTVYTAGEPCVAFMGQAREPDGAVYNFRVYERIQYVVRDGSSMRYISR